MSAQIDAPKYTYLKRGVYYFVSLITLVILSGCKNPFEPEKTPFEKYSQCVVDTAAALGDSVKEVCFRKFSKASILTVVTGRTVGTSTSRESVQLTNTSESLVLVDNINLKIRNNDGVVVHRLNKSCEPKVIAPKESDRIYCTPLPREDIEAFKEGLLEHGKEAAGWSFGKTLVIDLN